MSSRSTTLRDVAKHAGVSVSTVSRILTGVETTIAISEDTRVRVVQAAKDLSYRPHPGARALRGKTTNLLGVIVRDINDPFLAELIKVIMVAAKERGLEIVLGYAEADPKEAIKLSETMLDLRYCDGLLLVGDLKETQEDRLLITKIGWSSPLVLLCRGSSQLVGDNLSISCDNRAGTLLALHYLEELGHKKILFLGSSRLGDMNERQETFQDYMLNRFGHFDQGSLQPAENNLAGGYQGMLEVMNSAQLPTAILAADDVMAIGAMKAAADHAIRIPQDISIIGFDDIQVAGYTIPALTTVRQPIDRIGRRAVDLLDCLVKNGEGAYQGEAHIGIQPELIIRDSCCQSSP